MNLICFINDSIILLHGFLIFEWKNPGKSTKMFILILIPSFLSFLDSFFPFLSLKNLPFSSEQPFLANFFTFINKLILPMNINIHNFQTIFNKIKFNFMIKWCISSKARSMINLK